MDQLIKWVTTGDNFWYVIILVPILFTGLIKLIKAARGEAVDED